MDIQIAGRHVEVTDAMEAHVRQHVEKLPRFGDRVQYVTVTLGMDSGEPAVEIIAKCHRQDMVAVAHGHEIYPCIDEAFAKIQRQIARFHDKLVDHKGKNAQGTA